MLQWYGWFVQDASGSLTSRVPTSVSFPSLEDNMNVDEVNMVRTESGPLSKHSTGDSNEPRLATNAVSVGEWVCGSTRH